LQKISQIREELLKERSRSVSTDSQVTTAKQNQNPDVPSRFGFFETVKSLESIEDCKKDKVLACIAQFRNSNFTKELSEVIHSRAATFLNFQFIINGYASSNAVIAAWNRLEYVDNLEKFYRENHKESNTLARFQAIKWVFLFYNQNLSAQFYQQVFDLFQYMTEEELLDIVFQKSLITRVWAILSPHEPAKAIMGPTVLSCKSLELFFSPWMEFKVSKEQEIKKLTLEGYSVIPKVYMLSAGYNKEDKINDKKDVNAASGGVPSNNKNSKKKTLPNGKVSKDTLTVMAVIAL
jgi:hypothetical protein